MASTAETRTFREHMEQVDALLQELESSTDPASRRRVQGHHRCADGRPRAPVCVAYSKLLQRAGDAGRNILDSMTRDEMVAGVLLAHDLHPLDLETRIHQALEKVQPYAASHGGHIEVLAFQCRRRRRAACASKEVVTAVRRRVVTLRSNPSKNAILRRGRRK
jgi:hypothetical protein